ncbi:hypothetical protein L6Q21_04030 [Sandaracinobacter sp. RS1-74]|uniref:hypothetical protein n=1 Tax=Sandaracinobacteroides sayramensis TaxID=2913411 RepID=UPI001EDA13C6|nr:hypothetical protein [Sandaracinobacteroides sayramensis]MCG2840153.1 hypothetical protein [Sandaracinobacteroides sayramensis]
MRRDSDKLIWKSRLPALLLGLLLALALLVSNSVHAAEQMCEPIVELGADTGKGDHGRGDAGALHQHGGCHGHHVVAPLPRIEAGEFGPSREPTFALGLFRLSQAPPVSHLRPPIA